MNTNIKNESLAIPAVMVVSKTILGSNTYYVSEYAGKLNLTMATGAMPKDSTVGYLVVEASMIESEGEVVNVLGKTIKSYTLSADLVKEVKLYHRETTNVYLESFAKLTSELLEVKEVVEPVKSYKVEDNFITRLVNKVKMLISPSNI